MGFSGVKGCADDSPLIYCTLNTCFQKIVFSELLLSQAWPGVIFKIFAISGTIELGFSRFLLSCWAFQLSFWAGVTESIQDTSPRIDPSRNKKPVSDKGAPEFIRGVNA